MLNLPDPLAAYFAARTDADEASLATIFKPDAEVRDEAALHRGLPSIRAWQAETMAKTPFTVKPLALTERDGTVLVAAEVTGAFPGSPLMLDHRFMLRDGRVAALEII